MPATIGLERLKSNPAIGRAWGHCGLLANQASVTRDFVAAWDVGQAVFGGKLKALFGPQHGFYGTKQDNMIESGHDTHRGTGLPLYSLYSETREPSGAMLAGLDTLVIDLQIVGCRIYTWKATIAGCLRAAKKHGKKIVILDRPNPVGGEVIEGRVLDSDCTSFVGEYPIPMRHGLTAGEAARFFNSFIGAELEVVELEGWNPAHYWKDLERPWVLTSPNLPTPDSVYVYPGTVIFEGVNFSEGRGTGLPFQLIGAPYLPEGNAFKALVLQHLGGDAPGVHLRSAQFEPTSQKWRGETCKGIQIHVVEPERVRSLNLAIAIVRAAIELGEGKFAWKDPPYEYDSVTLPMRLIFGSKIVDTKFMDSNFSLEDPFWHEGVDVFIKRVEPLLLYKRQQRIG